MSLHAVSYFLRVLSFSVFFLQLNTVFVVLKRAKDQDNCRTCLFDLPTLKFKTWHFVSTRNEKSRKKISRTAKA